MKGVVKKRLMTFTLILILCWALSGITAFGGSTLVLLNDNGDSPGSWSMHENRIASVSSLDGGPPSGDPGAYYYFTNTSGGRDVGSARITRDAMFNADQKILSSLGQLQVDFYMDIYGWSEGTDNVAFKLYSLKGGVSTEINSSQRYLSRLVWSTIGETDLAVPKDADGIRIEIIANRVDGSDLDVYMDNITLYLYDETSPVMAGATVTGIKDYNNNVLPLKKDLSTGEFLENWVNTTDTILGKIDFNEPVAVITNTDNLNTNIQNKYGSRIYGNMGVSSGSHSYSHEYSIPLTGADKLSTGDASVKFIYGLNAGYGPFRYPVYDLGGNNTLSDIMKPNIDAYKIKLDNASPVITTPWDSYEGYISGRTSVDIVVSEENRGTEQSPLTMKYYWKYRNNSNMEVTEPEDYIIVSDEGVRQEDATYTTYTVEINIPNGSNIPPYQDFWLYAEVEDEARNNLSNGVILCKVNQKDSTPPVITWNESVHEDGTEVDLTAGEDMGYSVSRIVYADVNDLDSGVEEVKYLWTREPYNEDTDIISNMVLPGGDGRYMIHGSSLNTPLEGMYYLNIMATNGTEESVVASKGFFFDNEAPRVSGGAIYADGNPASAQYQVSDRALQSKFLYALLELDEPVTEPDISEGIIDDGMWKALELEGEGEERTASVTGVIDKITQSGYYKLVTRYYDDYYNCTEKVENLVYDFIPPYLEVVDAGEPQTFKKNHEVVLKVHDSMSLVDLLGDELSIKWVNVDSGDEIPVIPVIEPQFRTISIKGSEALNGKYYLKVKATDNAENTMEELVFVNCSHAEFCFDNSPPSINLAYDNDKATREIHFSYTGLTDADAGVALFRYGISASPDTEPSEWQTVNPASAAGEIVYPNEFTEDGEWYLSVLLQDTLGNEQSIVSTESYAIDVTDPTGKVNFGRGYTNKLDTLVHLEVDELKSKDSAILKTILSGDNAILEDGAIPDAQSSDWKNITYVDGLAVHSWKLSDTDGEQRVYVRFMDEAGNLSGIYEAAIILDRVAPTGEITYDCSLAEPTKNNVTASLTMSDNYTAALLNNNQENSYVFSRNGEFEFIFADEAGNKVRAKAQVDNIDKDPPEAAIMYSHPRDVWTNESITATLNLMDENDFIVLGDGTSTHTFNENGEFLFEFEDGLGNQGSIKAEVKNIDKEAPVGNIIFTPSDTAPVTVYLDVDEPVKVTNNDGSFRYVFDENGEFTFEFEDKAGNVGEATAYIYAINSAEKYVDVIYSDSGRLTSGSVEVMFIPVLDKVRITEPTVTDVVYGIYSSSFNENGELPVTFEVLAGEEEGSLRTVVGSVQNIDNTSPEGSVYISTDSPTNLPVTATLLSYDDKGKTIAIMNNNGESEYVFEENGTFTFDFIDEAGNTGHKAITVSNIDKSPPAAEISYITKETRENVIFAEIAFLEGADNVEILNNNGSNSFEFVENGSFTFLFADKAGNIGTATAQVNSLSGGELSGAIKYYIEEAEIADPNVGITNKSITARLFIDDEHGDCRIINNGGSSSYSFEKNGEFTFEFEDSRGNRGYATAKVSIIDKEAPKLNILADIVRATNKDVTITASYSDNKEIFKVMLNGEEADGPAGVLTYMCKENKSIQVTVFDTAGNETSKEFIVDYIDKEAPTATIEYTPDSFTNQNVRAVLSINEQCLITNNNGKMEYIFTGNGDFTFEFQDAAGNKASKTAVVNWMDKLPPVGTLEYSNKAATNKPVEVTVKSDEDFIVINNGRAAKRTFYRNGEFTFRLSDDAGNETTLKAEVGNIDIDKPQITLKGSTYVSILQDETYTEAGCTAIDNIDGDVSDSIITEGSVNTGAPGIYVLKYKVSDAVGNSSEASRTVKVIGTDEIVLLLNDKVVDGQLVILEDSDVKVSGFGNAGSCKIMWSPGKRTQAYFKTEGNIVAAGGTIKLEAGSWYTFFIQDRERKTKSIQVYINE